KEDRKIRYMKFTVGNDMHFTLWNEEIEYYRNILNEKNCIKCAFCRISINRFGREASLGTEGFMLDC
ncbi:MAG: hypothetical protein ACP5UV_07380, partial [Thermoplasmata archaeon]